MNSATSMLDTKYCSHKIVSQVFITKLKECGPNGQLNKQFFQ